jgi:hypothetical protein
MGASASRNRSERCTHAREQLSAATLEALDALFAEQEPEDGIDLATFQARRVCTRSVGFLVLT